MSWASARASARSAFSPRARASVRAICVTSSVCVRRLRKWSPGGSAGQTGKNLGFAGEAAKGARVQNARAVAGKRCAIGMRRLGDERCAENAVRFCGYGDSRGKQPASRLNLYWWSFCATAASLGYTASRERRGEGRFVSCVGHHHVGDWDVIKFRSGKALDNECWRGVLSCRLILRRPRGLVSCGPLRNVFTSGPGGRA